MTPADLLAMLPLLILAGGALAVMMTAAFHRGHGAAVVLALVALAATILSIAVVAPRAPQRIGGLLVIDSFALFYIGLIATAAMAVTIFSHGYLAKFHLKAEEYYILLLLATLGACTLVCSTHLASLFLGLELLSVSLYVMIAYVFRRDHSLEAALKYLILAAAASAFLLFGMALVYARTGSLALVPLVQGLLDAAQHDRALLAGFALMLTGFGFKLAWAPFHMWTPDVYQGAPAPVTAFIATVSKSAVVGVLLRFFSPLAQHQSSGLFTALAIVAVASMTLGNLLALRQGNFKRLLAYSSIAHLGYVLIAFLAGGGAGQTAVTFSIASYALATLAAFGLIGALATADGEAESVGDVTGLFWRRPWLALVLSLVLLSLIGLPLTAGFWGKFLILMAGVNSGLWTLTILLALNSALGLFYYLRVLMAAFAMDDMVSLPDTRPAERVVLGMLAAAILVLGLCPGLLLDLIQSLSLSAGL